MASRWTYPGHVKFLRRTKTDPAENSVGEEDEFEQSLPKGHTPSKGRATPTRREAEGQRRGPVAPPPQTTREALKRNKEVRKSNPASKEERRAEAQKRKEGMDAGDDRYLLPRDRGPVRAYVRDLVDSRRHVAGLFMPLAILVFIALLIPDPTVKNYSTLLCTVVILGMMLEGFLTGKRVTREVREKFPRENIKGRSIGWYAFIRASQLRKLRVPKPRVKAGETIS